MFPWSPVLFFPILIPSFFQSTFLVLRFFDSPCAPSIFFPYPTCLCFPFYVRFHFFQTPLFIWFLFADWFFLPAFSGTLFFTIQFFCYHPKHPNRCWPVGFRKAILSSTSFCLMATQKPWKPHWADHPYSMCSVHLSCCDKIPQHWDRFGRTQLAPLHWPTSRIVPSRLWMMELQTRSNNKAKGCFETWLQLNHHWQKQIAKRYQKALIKPRILLIPDTSTESWEIGKFWPCRHPGYGAKTDQPETSTQSHA